MKKHFYSHIITIDSIEVALLKEGLSEEERKHLVELAESSMHHSVVDAVLSQLEGDEKNTFLQHLSDENHGKIWEHFGEKAKDIEEKIKSTGESLLKRFHEDITESKK